MQTLEQQPCDKHVLVLLGTTLLVNGLVVAALLLVQFPPRLGLLTLVSIGLLLFHVHRARQRALQARQVQQQIHALNEQLNKNQRQLEQTLHHDAVLREAFHDLKGQISAVNLSLYLLQKKERPSTEHVQAMRAALSCAVETIHRISELRDASREQLLQGKQTIGKDMLPLQAPQRLPGNGGTPPLHRVPTEQR